MQAGLKGKNVIVQGLGNVGFYAGHFCSKAGAKITGKYMHALRVRVLDSNACPFTSHLRALIPCLRSPCGSCGQYQCVRVQLFLPPVCPHTTFAKPLRFQWSMFASVPPFVPPAHPPTEHLRQPTECISYAPIAAIAEWNSSVANPNGLDVEDCKAWFTANGSFKGYPHGDYIEDPLAVCSLGFFLVGWMETLGHLCERSRVVRICSLQTFGG